MFGSLGRDRAEHSRDDWRPEARRPDPPLQARGQGVSEISLEIVGLEEVSRLDARIATLEALLEQKRLDLNTAARKLDEAMPPHAATAVRAGRWTQVLVALGQVPEKEEVMLGPEVDEDEIQNYKDGESSAEAERDGKGVESSDEDEEEEDEEEEDEEGEDEDEEEVEEGEEQLHEFRELANAQGDHRHALLDLFKAKKAEAETRDLLERAIAHRASCEETVKEAAAKVQDALEALGALHTADPRLIAVDPTSKPKRPAAKRKPRPGKEPSAAKPSKKERPKPQKPKAEPKAAKPEKPEKRPAEKPKVEDAPSDGEVFSFQSSKKFRDWFKARRTKLGLSQGQLAEAVGVSQTKVSFWENGHSAPSSAEELEDLYEVLGAFPG